MLYEEYQQIKLIPNGLQTRDMLFRSSLAISLCNITIVSFGFRTQCRNPLLATIPIRIQMQNMSSIAKGSKQCQTLNISRTTQFSVMGIKHKPQDTDGANKAPHVNE